MVYVNNPFDVTLAPPNSSYHGVMATLKASARSTTGMSFEQAKRANAIYQGNGHICQMKMCNSITGCDSPNGCQDNKHWKDIVNFCGPNGANGLSMEGAWWVLEPKDAHQQLLTATQENTGLTRLPTPYNVVGMY